MSAPPTEVYRPEKSEPNAKEFEQLDRDIKESLSYVMLTIFCWEPDTGHLRRIYSSDPEKYPVGGSKKMLPTAPWPSTVIFSQKVHLCWNRDDIKATFSDYENIFSTGSHTQLSIPLVEEGKTVGAINASGAEGSYADDAEVERCVERFQREGLEAFRRWRVGRGP